MENVYNKSELAEDIIFWAKNNISPSFEFRQYQLETIVDIVYNILVGKNHTQIIEAPTGSGKSILNIISACFLADDYDLQSYILCTDLYLWKQYEDFLRKHQTLNRKVGMLKGQTGNYECRLNKKDMRNADCRMAGVSWSTLFNLNSAISLGYECAANCPYVKARKKAMKSKVTIMTYALYHYQLNIVANDPKIMTKSPWKKRDIIFCDECHNMPNIMSLNFKPCVKYNDIEMFKTIYNFYYNKFYAFNNSNPTLFGDDDNLFKEENNLLVPTNQDICEFESIMPINLKMSWDDILEKWNNVWDVLKNPNASSDKNHEAIKNMLYIYELFADNVVGIESFMSFKKQIMNKKYSKTDIDFYKACSKFRNCMCLWNDYSDCINKTGTEYMLKGVSESRIDNATEVYFSCVKEDFITYNYLLKNANNRVMMSATIGGYDAFYENVGLKYIEEAKDYGADEEILYTVIPSTFDFSKSPIHFLNRFKMSFNEKDISLPKLSNIIYKICESNFPNERGMIQTGSYANAKIVYDNAPANIKKRMLLYNNAKEKTNIITLHQMSKDTILIGPTLVEGIDLPGDQCRFIIILKVPYPIIKDDYVKKKMTLFPEWYNSTTSNNIIQGIGRGVRSKNDYCTTYILDACFLTLYNATKDQYPIELQQRIQIYS